MLVLNCVYGCFVLFVCLVCRLFRVGVFARCVVCGFDVVDLTDVIWLSFGGNSVAASVICNEHLLSDYCCFSLLWFLLFVFVDLLVFACCLLFVLRCLLWVSWILVWYIVYLFCGCLAGVLCFVNCWFGYCFVVWFVAFALVVCSCLGDVIVLVVYCGWLVLFTLCWLVLCFVMCKFAVWVCFGLFYVIC